MRGAESRQAGEVFGDIVDTFSRARSSAPPPLRGRVGEGEAETAVLVAPPSLPLTRKGGGNETVVAPSRHPNAKSAAAAVTAQRRAAGSSLLTLRAEERVCMQLPLRRRANRSEAIDRDIKCLRNF